MLQFVCFPENNRFPYYRRVEFGFALLVIKIMYFQSNRKIKPFRVKS